MTQLKFSVIGASSPLLLLLLGSLLVIILGWTWFTLDPQIGARTKAGLLILRAATSILVMILFLQPTVSLQEVHTEPERIALLLDTSASMSHSSGHRLAAAREKLKPHLSRITSGSRTLHRFVFDESARTVDDFSLETSKPRLSYGTDIVGTLNQLADEYRETPFSAVILLSDGDDMKGLDQLSELRFPSPVNTVFINDTEEIQDLRIVDVQSDTFAFVRKPTPIVVTIENQGLDIQSVPVRILHQGRLLLERQVDLIEQRAQIEFQITPQAEEDGVYTVSLPVPPTDRIPDNNTRHIHFEVIRDRYRILHLVGAPSYDQRFMRDFLSSWPQVDLVSFYALRTPRQAETDGAAAMALIPFPTTELFTEHLASFDILLFQDFDPEPVGVDPYLDKIADFVRQGGALAVVGYQKGLTAASIATSPLLALLPLDLPPASTPEHQLLSTSPFVPVLTVEGRVHPITSPLYGNAPEPSPLRSLPRLARMLNTTEKQTDTVTLLQHPKRGLTGDFSPLVAVAESGKGRTLMVTTDALWTWRFTSPLSGGPAGVYAEFWKRAIQWLTRDPEFERIRISIPPSDFSADRSMVFHLQALNSQYMPLQAEPLQVEIEWLTAEGVKAQSIQEVRTNNSGQYALEWEPESSGPHLITVSSRDNPYSARKNFLIHPESPEIYHMGTNEAFLRQLAALTGGRHFSTDLDPAAINTRMQSPHRIASRADTEIWSHPGSLLLLFLLLGVEWFIRRRRGLR